MRSPSIHPSRKEGVQIVYHQPIDHSTLAPTTPIVLTGNVTLCEIFVLEKISKSKAYKLGIVPLYDKNGALIENGATPPFPWLRLPSPIIKTGKKLFDAESIMAWHRSVRARALQADSSTSDAAMPCEVPYGR